MAKYRYVKGAVLMWHAAQIQPGRGSFSEPSSQAQWVLEDVLCAEYFALR